MTTQNKRGLEGEWPHVTVAALLVDERMERALIMHRSNEVRSAKDCWSVPTGLLEHGEDIDEALLREVEEELGLVGGRVLDYTAVSANQPGDGFHWILVMRPVVVPDLSKFVNREPDKHDEVRLMSHMELYDHAQAWDGYERGAHSWEECGLNFSGGLCRSIIQLLDFINA